MIASSTATLVAASRLNHHTAARLPAAQKRVITSRRGVTTQCTSTSTAVPRLSVPGLSATCWKSSSRRTPSLRRMAAVSSSSDAEEVYSGMFGEWRVEEQDVKEVTAYRVGISVATLCLLIASSSNFVPADSGLHETLVSILDPVTLVGVGGLGASLVLIHIYVTPLKRFLQLLYATGTIGAVAIMATQDQPAAVYVAEHPLAVLAVGPLFASVTGLAFKEGLCYGKFEAAALFFVVPTLLLGHMFGFLPEEGERGLLAAFCLLASVFAARKYTQPIKDDIGDKSVFEFQALSEEEQQQKLAELQAAKQPADDNNQDVPF